MSNSTSASHVTHGRVIFDGFSQGADSTIFASAVIVVLIALAVLLYARSLGQAHKSGLPPTSNRRSTTLIWTLVGPNANAVSVITLGLAAVAVTLLLSQWSADRKRLATGTYATAQGPITGLVVTQLNYIKPSALNSLAGQRTPAQEFDDLIVDDHHFLLKCFRHQDAPAPVLGGPGACLDATPGTRVEVDYIQLTTIRYNPEPLRVTLLDP